jgi:hypothetical protein
VLTPKQRRRRERRHARRAIIEAGEERYLRQQRRRARLLALKEGRPFPEAMPERRLLSDACLFALAASPAKLRTLRLRGSGVTDIGVGAFLAARGSFLRVLDLSLCEFITGELSMCCWYCRRRALTHTPLLSSSLLDESVRAVQRYCGALEHLTIRLAPRQPSGQLYVSGMPPEYGAGAVGITDGGLSQMARYCMRTKRMFQFSSSASHHTVADVSDKSFLMRVAVKATKATRK